jgi:hypothetical protein
MFVGPTAGTLASVSNAIIGPSLTSTLGIGAGGAAEAAAAAGAVPGATASGTAAEVAAIESGVGFLPEAATGVAETTASGLEALGAGPWSLETAATAGEAIEGGLGAAEAAQLAVPELAGEGMIGTGGVPGGPEAIEGLGTAFETPEAAAEAGVELAEPSFMEKVQSGLEAFGENPLQETMNLAGKVVQTAADRPAETMGLAMAADAFLPGGGGEDDPGPGKTWEEVQEGDGDPFLMDQLGGGGGGMTPGREFIVESGVPDRLYPSPSDEMLSGMPGAKGNMLARRGGAMEEGIGMMPVGPEMAAPVGIAGREIPGQEEALAMFQEGDFGEEMSIEEMIEGLPPGMTIEDMEELWAMYGPDVMRGMV